MRASILAIALAAVGGSALWGQAQTSQPPGKSEYQKAYDEAYEKSFRAAFRRKSIGSCVLSASEATAAGYDITPTCTCAADTLLATHTVEQLKELSPEALEPVTAQCLKTDPPERPSRQERG